MCPGVHLPVLHAAVPSVELLGDHHVTVQEGLAVGQLDIVGVHSRGERQVRRGGVVAPPLRPRAGDRRRQRARLRLRVPGGAHLGLRVAEGVALLRVPLCKVQVQLVPAPSTPCALRVHRVAELGADQLTPVFEIAVRALGGSRSRVHAQIDALERTFAEGGSAVEQLLDLFDSGELAQGYVRHCGYLWPRGISKPRVKGTPAQEATCLNVVYVKREEVARQPVVLDRVQALAPLAKEYVAIPLEQVAQGLRVQLQPMLQAAELGVRVPVDPLRATLQPLPILRVQRDAQVRAINLLLHGHHTPAAAEESPPLLVTYLVVLRGRPEVLEVGRAGELQLALLEEGTLEALVLIHAGCLGQVQLLSAQLKALAKPLLHHRALALILDGFQLPARPLEHGQGLPVPLQHDQGERAAAQRDLAAGGELGQRCSVLEHQFWPLEQTLLQAEHLQCRGLTGCVAVPLGAPQGRPRQLASSISLLRPAACVEDLPGEGCEPSPGWLLGQAAGER
mmetsp:Transcript_26067/g.77888  ORF Transcript_26067/g.77888 Transcript_26067/m.77888 type:complete len:507 (+) Transcript_26067:2479-3999(+)